MGGGTASLRLKRRPGFEARTFLLKGNSAITFANINVEFFSFFFAHPVLLLTFLCAFLQEEVCDMINKKYSEFLPNLQASEDLMQQVDTVSKEMETLKNCIEFEVWLKCILNGRVHF